MLADFDDTQGRDKALYLTWLASSYLQAREVNHDAEGTARRCPQIYKPFGAGVMQRSRTDPPRMADESIFRLGHDLPMPNYRSNADRHAQTAKNLQTQAKRAAGEKQSALWSEAILEALLGIQAELRHAAEGQGQLPGALRQHGAIMEEAASKMLRASRER